MKASGNRAHAFIVEGFVRMWISVLWDLICFADSMDSEERRQYALIEECVESSYLLGFSCLNLRVLVNKLVF